MLTVIQGDALDKLRELPAESVQCCVTSPPYFGLRDYGTASWEGGDDDCDHKQGRSGSGRADGIVDERGQRTRDGVGAMGGDCQKCGARRIDTQLGLESTPEEYVGKLVEVFREVRRVLKNDGTLWLVIGDSYASNAATSAGKIRFESYRGSDTPTLNAAQQGRIAYRGGGIKSKDLCGIPWRVAFAIQVDGWYLRSDIIWAKPNPMPESVTDRPTKAHEYLFLLSKRGTYFYHADAIKEKRAEVQGSTYSQPDKAARLGITTNGTGLTTLRHRNNEDRNKRSVWTVATAPYSDAHFATYPPDLIKPCILAGTKAGDVVLDPFAGSGTTGQVALELGRKAILIELNAEYISLIEQRCNTTIGFAF
jgi:DNA modification methylase